MQYSDCLLCSTVTGICAVLASVQASKEDFEIVRLIGEGAHAKVFEVLRKDDSKTLAMKVMNKEEIINLGQVNICRRIDWWGR